MKTVDVTYVDDDYDLVITLREANGFDGIRFSSLQAQASAALSQDASQAEFAVYVWTYPACMASLEKVTGKGSENLSNTMGVKEFLGLPWNLIRTLESGAYGANPTFSPFWRLQKKDQTGSTES